MTAGTTGCRGYAATPHRDRPVAAPVYGRDRGSLPGAVRWTQHPPQPPPMTLREEGERPSTSAQNRPTRLRILGGACSARTADTTSRRSGEVRRQARRQVAPHAAAVRVPGV